jgi:hypothetical protein
MKEYKEYIVRVFSDRTVWLNKEKELHRENGPAVEYANGTKYWYLNGTKYTEAEYNKKIAENKSSYEGKIVEIEGKKYKLIEEE